MAQWLMKATRGIQFRVLSFTGIVEAVAESGTFIEFAHVSSSGFTRSVIGSLSLLHPCEGMWRVRMTLAIPADYHMRLNEIRDAVFTAVGIPLEESWTMKVCPPSVIEASSEPSEGIMLVSSG
jgi:hypothetical protein